MLLFGIDFVCNFSNQPIKRMQKTLTFLAALLCFSLSSFATNVYGIINSNTTWTKANSPYIIIGDLLLDSNVTLTIEPGAEVRGKPNYNFYIYGKIIATGTVTDTIKFTQDHPVPSIPYGLYGWEGLSLKNPHLTDTFVFDYCRFEYAHYAIFTANHSKVTNCIFANNGQAIRSTNNYQYVSNCLFFNNAFGIYSGSGGYTHIENCGFSGNASAIFGKIFKLNNNAIINSENAINASIDTIRDNLIIHASNYAVLGSFKYLANNKIWQSNTAIRYESGIVEHNTIKYCNTAIYLYNAVGSNAIRNNCITHSYVYNVDGHRLGLSTSDVTNNYWGETDSAIIAAKIYDYYDTLAFTVGIINFIPVLQNPDLSCVDTFTYPPYYFPTSINKVNNHTVLTVYPNPISSSFTIDAGTETMQEVFIYNMTGSLVYYTTTSKNKLEINASSFPIGMYMYKVRLDDESILTGKVLKE